MIKFLSVFLVFLLMSAAVKGQEVVEDLMYNRQVAAERLQMQHLRASGAILDTLPFVDDFSYRSALPDPDRWTDQQVYINSNYPISPPSIGVATFDALDQNGEPYSTGNSTGPADTLTSQPLKIGSLIPADSLILSFFYQAKGRGNVPEAHDSIILEFLGSDTIWRQVWSAQMPGAPTTTFQQVMLRVDQNTFFHDNFQFRFRNFATLTGNNDHWHIDYVILDKDRSINDTALNDVAFYRPASSLLKNFSAMPLDQFIGFEAQELNDSLIVYAKNHFLVQKNTTFAYAATEDCNGSTINSDIMEAINFQPQAAVTISDPLFLSDLQAAMPGINCEELRIITRYSLGNTPPDVSTSFNDTIYQETVFSNYLAYDDGTAEQAYGLVGSFAQLAMEYNLNKPDTLRAIRIHFAHVDKDVSHLSFVLKVWSDIDFNGGQENVLYQQPFQNVHYVDSINGFHTYRLDTPVVVSGKFYIGLQQEFEESLRMGMDVNNNSKQHLFFNTLGTWNASTVNGAVMMRAVLGAPIPLGVGDIFSTQKEELKIYPNPASDILRFELPTRFRGSVAIFDHTGRVVMEEIAGEQFINIEHLIPGMYIINARGENGKIYTNKFIKIE